MTLGDVFGAEARVLDAPLNVVDGNSRALNMGLVVDLGVVAQDDAVDLLGRRRMFDTQNKGLRSVHRASTPRTASASPA